MEKWRLKLISAKVEVEVEAELGKIQLGLLDALYMMSHRAIFVSR